jgi:hypothetical protein
MTSGENTKELPQQLFIVIYFFFANSAISPHLEII